MVSGFDMKSTDLAIKSILEACVICLNFTCFNPSLNYLLFHFYCITTLYETVIKNKYFRDTHLIRCQLVLDIKKEKENHVTIILVEQNDLKCAIKVRYIKVC